MGNELLNVTPRSIINNKEDPKNMGGGWVIIVRPNVRKVNLKKTTCGRRRTSLKQIVCERCGGNDFLEQNGFRTCKYCLTRFVIQPQDRPQKSSTIALENDIKTLLKKCRDDPTNARRYASLVLDIDPTNYEASKYL